MRSANEIENAVFSIRTITGFPFPPVRLLINRLNFIHTSSIPLIRMYIAISNLLDAGSINTANPDKSKGMAGLIFPESVSFMDSDSAGSTPFGYPGCILSTPV
ncbi:hypothetical protein AYI68_g4330 [Smittium mucronatum]|uniref:Uncharacterized protein n=1 Tax=Smittium mucronatum TaxID=133383 RepID=A0A1R0GXE0_9FUNG|nr:hypothetical protein AYI68_g4330 [Smittium mucronatum]